MRLTTSQCPCVELELAALCCIWPPRPEVDARLVERTRSIRWQLLFKILQRHHIEALAWHALHRSGAALPEQSAQELKAKAQTVAVHSLLQAREASRLNEEFENRGLPIVFLKGSTLGTLAYGTVALKRSKDIDILAPPRLLPDAARVLGEAGYYLVFPRAVSHEQLPSWHRHCKESGWRHKDSGVIVELHTSLADNARLLAGLNPFEGNQLVEVPSVGNLPTLARDELFAYLCVHGASSAWFRLKWIADFAAMFGRVEPRELERLYLSSQELGAGRAAAQALLLANAILCMSIAPAFKRRLETDRSSRLLRASAMRMIAGADPTQRILGTLPIHWSQFWLLPGWRFILGELARQLVSPYDRMTSRSKHSFPTIEG